jgi:hypothetical protein
MHSLVATRCDMARPVLYVMTFHKIRVCCCRENSYPVSLLLTNCPVTQQHTPMTSHNAMW